MKKIIQWEKDANGVHGFIFDRDGSKEVVLRLAFNYIPYSFGTRGYALLQLLTKSGFKVLMSIHIMEYGKEIGEAKDHETRLKAYAEFLYNTPTPSVGESD